MCVCWAPALLSEQPTQVLTNVLESEVMLEVGKVPLRGPQEGRQSRAEDAGGGSTECPVASLKLTPQAPAVPLSPMPLSLRTLGFSP